MTDSLWTSVGHLSDTSDTDRHISQFPTKRVIYKTPGKRALNDSHI